MSKKKIDLSDMFDVEDGVGDAHEEWRGMPEFNQPNNGAYRQVIVSFEDQEGVEEFFRLINQSYSSKTKSVWFPDREGNKLRDLFVFDEETVPEDIKSAQKDSE